MTPAEILERLLFGEGVEAIAAAEGKTPPQIRALVWSHLWTRRRTMLCETRALWPDDRVAERSARRHDRLLAELETGDPARISVAALRIGDLLDTATINELECRGLVRLSDVLACDEASLRRQGLSGAEARRALAAAAAALASTDA